MQYLMYFLVLVSLALIIGIAYRLWKNLESKTVYQTQKGLLFKDGKLVQVLDAGHYRYNAKRSSIDVFDMRRRALDTLGQEILTQDNINIRISVVGQIQVMDPVKVMEQSESYMSEVYAVCQLAIRNAVASVTLDEFLAQKSALDKVIQDGVTDKTKDLGVAVTNLAVRDIMLPANLKKAYGGVLEAKKNAEVNLEKARGEQAVLRSLVNSSKLYSENPSLMQARVIQALSTGNNSIVFGTDESIAVKKK